MTTMTERIIIIDDEQDFLESIRRGLVTSGYRDLCMERDALAAADRIRSGQEFDVALIDITMPGMTGIELLSLIKAESPRTECIMVTAIDEARVAVECLKKGAYDYLVKPISKEELLQSISRTLERKRLYEIIELGKQKTPPELANKEAFAPIVTRSITLRRILREAELHARSDVPVLITGETGTGKELLARAIHEASNRRRQRFTPINVETIDNHLFASEFFGHVKGAFTGAEAGHAGIIEDTHRGTLFLDEIGNLPMEIQGKLLRVLQSGEYIKVGTNRPQTADIRVIAATNEDLEKLIARKRFRKDLYYRLRGAWLDLPPLRDRREDIPLLVNHFVRAYTPGRVSCRIDDAAMDLLLNYAYPGNVRELMTIVQSALNLSQGRDIVAANLGDALRKRRTGSGARGPSESSGIIPLAEMEKNHIQRAYDLSHGNKSQAARQLKISLSTLRRKLDHYGIT